MKTEGVPVKLEAGLLLLRYFSFRAAVNKVKIEVTKLLLTWLCLYCSQSLATQVACGPPLRSAVPFGQVISTVPFPSPLQQMRCQALISWVVRTPPLLLLHPLLPMLPILLKTWDRPTILGEFGAQQLEEEVQILGLIHTILTKTDVKQKERTLVQVMIQFWMQIFETSFSGCCWSLLPSPLPHPPKVMLSSLAPFWSLSCNMVVWDCR